MTPYYEDAAVTIYHCDCREVLGQVQTTGCDVILTDAPYDEQTHAGARTNKDGGGPIIMGFAPLDSVKLVTELRWLPKRWCITFCSLEMLGAYRAAAGVDYIRGGFWHRVDGMPQVSGDRPAQPGEALAILHREGQKRWNRGGHPAFWTCGVVRGEQRVHPTQKPERLMEMLIVDFTDPGDTIFDPFMGSGTTLVSAKRLGRRAIGAEVDEAHCRTAVQRLAQSALPMFDEG